MSRLSATPGGFARGSLDSFCSLDAAFLLTIDIGISNVGATIRTSRSRLKPPDARDPAIPDLSGEMLNLAEQVAPVQKKKFVDRMLKQQYFKQHFEQAYRAAPIVRIDMIKHGVPATLVVELAAQLCISKEQLCRTLGLARATIDRKVREASLLSPDETSRVLGLSRLVAGRPVSTP